MKTLELETPHGRARAFVYRATQPVAALVLSHGAGGGVGAADIEAARDVALARGVSVALVEQPYRVAGKRMPAPAKRLDAAWISIIEQLQQTIFTALPVITGGRSMGSRVACRTAAATGAPGVLCLAFPLQPQRKGKEVPSRLPELDMVEVPVLIVQGDRDPFGMPPPAPNRTIAVVAGDHSLKKDLDAVRAAIDSWLADLLG